MERRQEPRIIAKVTAQVTATLTLLTPAAPEQEVVVVDFSGRGACIALDTRLASGTCIQLQLDDCLYLGEVTYCREAAGRYQAGLFFEQSISHIGDIERLMQALLADSGATKPTPSRESPRSRR